MTSTPLLWKAKDETTVLYKNVFRFTNQNGILLYQFIYYDLFLFFQAHNIVKVILTVTSYTVHVGYYPKLDEMN